MPSLPPTEAGFVDAIESFELYLRHIRRSKKTIRIYTDAAYKMADWLGGQAGPWCSEKKNKCAHPPAPGVDFAGVCKHAFQRYMVWFQENAVNGRTGRTYSGGYANNQYRALQQFWKWHAAEEDLPNPMAESSPPTVDDTLVPVPERDDVAALIHDAEKGRDFTNRRDAAILRLFACTGIRLEEMTTIEIESVNLERCEVTVIGKAPRGRGKKTRVVKFDYATAQALKRYLRLRAGHKKAHSSARLWLGPKGAMTESGIRQSVYRRAGKLGIKIYPHMFRHWFSDRFLDEGGAEGDLMELNGWESPQMLARYGRALRGRRARRAYDRINIMGDI